MHSYKDMGIVTIPLKRKVTHKEIIGKSTNVSYGDVLSISAGRVFVNSEFNANEDLYLELFQI